MNAGLVILNSLLAAFSLLIATGSRSSLSDEPAKAEKPAAEPILGKETGQVRDDNALKMNLVWCPPGFLAMEQVEAVTKAVELDDGTIETRRVEKITPVKVFLTRGYWLGKYEVTQADWNQVMATEPWKGQDFTKEGDDFPVTFASWNDAMAFCRKLTEGERKAGRLPDGWEYTLPTEAQWERACRARTETRFSFGDDETQLGDYAWFDGNALDAREQYAHRVGQKKPNPWGLYDMHGNVWEWCRDWFSGKLPGGRDPDVTEATAGSFRVVRGGGWNCGVVGCRSAYRRDDSTVGRSRSIGFRVVLAR